MLLFSNTVANWGGSMKHTREQIANFFQWLKDNIGGCIDPYEFSEEHQAITLELLELQIPKQEVEKITEHRLNDILIGTEKKDYCPTCDKMFYDQEWEDEVNYCSNCGQRIKWSDGEKK